ncbi:MAG: methyltransferase [Spirochaetaceae bacterium]|nr:MAG: methyltransferase [Spirochaetaceae bacterium]
MNSRERVLRSLNHEEPDRVPLDLGASVLTGMHVSSVYKLRQALKLDSPGTPVKVLDPYQMLGEVAMDLVDALEVDVVQVPAATTLFGYKREGWKPWALADGTPVLVPAGFNTVPEANGDILMYPEGDQSAAPSGRMPAGGFYFDEIVRQPPLEEEKLDPADNAEEFSALSKEELGYFEAETDRLHSHTDKAVFAGFCFTSFGDIALVPAPWLKNPKGIRDIEEWYISTVTRQEYVYRVFERQCEVAIANLDKLHRKLGNKVHVTLISGTDFGAQNNLFISKQSYRDLFKPFHKTVNDWLHKNTGWKTFIHSCGSVVELIADFIEAGFDILNPVQTAAAGMDPKDLKERFGEQIVFWGGGVDTQRTLPFGTAEEVRREVRERVEILRRGGGFVFAGIHNIQAGVPVENLLALFEAFREYR